MADPILTSDAAPELPGPASSPDDPTPDQLSAQRLAVLTADFDRLKQQKARKAGGVEGRILLSICFEGGEHYVNYNNRALSMDPKEDGKLQLTFNLITPRTGKLMGRIAAMNGVYGAVPDKTDPKSLDNAEVVDQLIRGLDQKLDQPSITWQILYWLFVGGVAFEEVCWVPNAGVDLVPATTETGELVYKNTVTGEEMPQPVMELKIQSGEALAEQFEVAQHVQLTGDVGSEVLSPLQVFVDQSVKSFDTMAPDQRVYIARIRTTGWIKDNYGVDVPPMKEISIVSSRFNVTQDAIGGVFLKDIIPLIQGSQDQNDQPSALVVDAFTPASQENPQGLKEVFIPGDQILLSEPNPYGEIPIVDYHFRPVTTSFWTRDYVSSLIPAQRFLNKRFSQLGEQSNSTLYSSLLLGPGLKQEDIPTDYPGVIVGGLDEKGTPLVGRLAPPQLPSWFTNSFELVLSVFNDMAGGADLFGESKFPGQIRGPMAVPMLQEILDTEWGPLYIHLGERMAKAKQMRLNRVAQYYPPERTMNFTSADQRDEVLEFHTDEILKSGTNYTITVERSSLVPELRALREARLIERLSGPLSILYLDERTGAFDKSKIAADLHFGDAGRESREAQYHKLGAEITGLLRQGQPVPPVMPFYDHAIMMDELEAWMATTEFLHSDPAIQQMFGARWEEHRQYLMQEAQAQQQSMMMASVQSAAAQATQQAAAMAASQAVDGARQVSAANRAAPTERIVAEAEGQASGQQRPQR